MTWDELEKEIQALASQIKDPPEIIMGVVRGGIIPARLLASKLHIKDMSCLTIKKLGNERKVVTEISEDIRSKKILLVEDMLETGKSLVVARQYLQTKGAVVKTACLYIMPISEIHPDYFLKEVDEIIKFPWE